MISAIRAIELFMLVMLIRLASSPLEVYVSVSGVDLSFSWLAPALAFMVSFLVVTYKRRASASAEDWAIVLGMTLVAFVPLTLAIPLFMISLLILGWLMHISGRTMKD